MDIILIGIAVMMLIAVIGYIAVNFYLTWDYNTPKKIIERQDVQGAYHYAMKTGQRFIEAEDFIARNPYWACEYAIDVMKRRWYRAEDRILNYVHWCSPGPAEDYRRYFKIPKKRKSEGLDWQKVGF